jgi:hypothetical protein
VGPGQGRLSTVRRYVFAFFAACVALAAGIALGAGPLQGAATADGPASADTSSLHAEVASLEAGQAFGTAVASATSHGTVAKKLSGGAITLVVLPGVGDRAVSGMRDALTRAGGAVNVTVRLSDRMVDPVQKTYASSVAASSMKGLGDLGRWAHAQPYAQLGALLARAYAGTGSDLSVDQEAVEIDSELQGARLVSLEGTVHRRGSLVVVLGAGEHGTDDVTVATHAIELQVLSSVAASTRAVLVATAPTGTAPGGLLTAIERTAPLWRSVSTLNVLDGPAAQVAAVFTLAAAAAGTTGHYGVEETSVSLPPGLATGGG